MVTVTVSPKYQVVIPKEIRKEMELKPGQKLQIFHDEERIIFIPVRNIRDLRGFVKGINTSVKREKDRI
ncbi:MAG TPA: AbrB/MazE/SpoVT family DNA-binding domain-containing protein [Caldithrix abyssi]|uniref:AbrB/MazE/SpoVT family DNA-binding domain-containing protein n=1 Tax=Caldithrix abyssi TaxID=187145 RepID=A0A7V4TZX1_CALAY|nr:AbrB/MazE/SpoVT family DNA-binding domain-containing protein [Caldithrix abyssi]